MKNRKIDIEVSPDVVHLVYEHSCDLAFTTDKATILNHFNVDDILDHFSFFDLLEQMDFRDVKQWVEGQKQQAEG